MIRVVAKGHLGHVVIRDSLAPFGIPLETMQ